MKIRLAAIERGDLTNCLERMGYTLWMQGCSIRCKGCHNPALQSDDGGFEMHVDEIVADILRNKHWLKNGMVVFLGGEPTDQLLQLLYINYEVRAAGIDTMLYTGRTEQELLDMGVPPAIFNVVKVGRFNEQEKAAGEALASHNQYYLMNGERVYENKPNIRAGVRPPISGVSEN